MVAEITGEDRLTATTADEPARTAAGSRNAQRHRSRRKRHSKPSGVFRSYERLKRVHENRKLSPGAVCVIARSEGLAAVDLNQRSAVQRFGHDNRRRSVFQAGHA